MWRVICRYVREVQEAEDVLVQGFHKVFTHLHQFEWRGDDSLEKWIRKIMVNESLMALRRRKLWLAPEEDADGESADWQPGADLDAEVIYGLIRQLPDGYRAVFNLFAIEGYSHAEIAERLQINEGTSRSQLSKAKGLLQQWVRQLENNQTHAEYGKALQAED
jgi:RNA polymerase sigma-70 factor (ECF subfamily)